VIDTDEGSASGHLLDRRSPGNNTDNRDSAWHSGRQRADQQQVAGDTYSADRLALFLSNGIGQGPSGMSLK